MIDVGLHPGVSLHPGDVAHVNPGPGYTFSSVGIPHHALHAPVGGPDKLQHGFLVVLPLGLQAGKLESEL